MNSDTQLNLLTRMMEQGRSFSGRERNCCFLNTTPGGRFATISAVSGLDYPDDGRAVALVDWDQDGYPDMWITNRNAPRLRFMRNNHPQTNHYLALQLQGNGTTTNRDAIGSTVEVVSRALNGKRLVKSLRAGEGFLSQSSKVMHFGLGQLSMIDKVIVHWSAGKAEEFTGIDINQRYQLVQGSGTARKTTPAPRQLVLEAAEQIPLPASTGIRVPLVMRLAMPEQVGYKSFEEKPQTLGFPRNKPTLLVMWASWCAPCQAELLDLAKRDAELKAAGIEVITLCVDGLGEDGSNPEDGPNFLRKKGIPFTHGRCLPEFAQLMTGYHHMLTVITRPLPVPVSFLVDREGNLAYIYKGRLAVDDVLRDASIPAGTLRDRWLEAACLPGAMLDHEGMLLSLKQLEVGTRYELGYTYSASEQHENALRHYQAVIATDPTFGEAYLGLGNVYTNTNQLDKALESYQKALKLSSETSICHYCLGVVYGKMGRVDRAQSHYQEALRADPKNTMAQQALARLQKRQR
ncbi:MAG: tetratricopeptide repeat protein [Gemmatales bacterium]